MATQKNQSGNRTSIETKPTQTRIKNTPDIQSIEFHTSVNAGSTFKNL